MTRRIAIALIVGVVAMAAAPSTDARTRHHAGGNNTMSSYNVICLALSYMGVAKADCRGRR